MALLYKRLLDLNIAWFAPLTLSTKQLVGGIRPAHTNVIDFAYRTAGSNRVPAVKSGSSANAADIVQLVASYNATTKTAYVIVFNHNPDYTANTVEPVTVNLSRIKPATGTTVNIKKWMVDDTHANFWPTWLVNAASCGIPDNGYVLSKHSSEVPLNLKTPYKYCWKNAHPALKTAAALNVVSNTNQTTPGNALTLTPNLQHHAVMLYEIGNAAIAP
jgi:hypothetical protein